MMTTKTTARIEETIAAIWCPVKVLLFLAEKNIGLNKICVKGLRTSGRATLEAFLAFISQRNCHPNYLLWKAGLSVNKPIKKLPIWPGP